MLFQHEVYEVEHIGRGLAANEGFDVLVIEPRGSWQVGFLCQKPPFADVARTHYSQIWSDPGGRPVADAPPLLGAGEDDQSAVTSLEPFDEFVEVSSEGVVDCEVIFVGRKFQ